MDANTLFLLSSGFPQIVSLLATFYSINSEKFDLDEFKSWLDESNSQYAIEIIDNNRHLQNALTEFMTVNHEENMVKLSNLSDLIIDIATRIENLSQLTTPLKDSINLSAQAIDLLRQFVKSKSPSMYHMNTQSLGDYQHDYILEGSDKIEYDDLMFIEDDIKSLVDTGLITETFSPKGNVIYKITRQAVAFIKSIDNQLT